jgi:dihydrofolate reductase
MPAPYRVEGLAIVSEDGMIADSEGLMPNSLKFEADQVFYANELDRMDVVVNGRRSHEWQPNSHLRRRLVVTRKVASLATNPEQNQSFLWNPAGASLAEACAALGLTAGSVGIIGGMEIFGLFLDIGYDVFHLSRAPGVKLPGGMPVFPQVRTDFSPEDVLIRYGFQPGPQQVLDAVHDVTLVSWSKVKTA